MTDETTVDILFNEIKVMRYQISSLKHALVRARQELSEVSQQYDRLLEVTNGNIRR